MRVFRRITRGRLAAAIRVGALDEGELVLDERARGRVRGRPGLGDEVEFAVRARGIAVERHEHLDDALAASRRAYYLVVRAPLPIKATEHGHKTDTSETTRATVRDASPALKRARFAGETAPPVIGGVRA